MWPNSKYKITYWLYTDLYFAFYAHFLIGRHVFNPLINQSINDIIEQICKTNHHRWKFANAPHNAQHKYPVFKLLQLSLWIYIYIYICAGMQLLFNVTTLIRNTFPAFKDLNAKTRSSIPYKAAVQCQCPTSLPSATQVWLVWRRINVLYSNHTIFFPPSILLPGGMPKIAKHWQKCSRILQLMFSKQYTRSL